MKTITKLLLAIGVLLTWTNQIVAMRPMLKDGELPPDEARLEPDFSRELEPEPRIETDFNRELEVPETGEDEYLFEEDLKKNETLLTQVLKKNLTREQPKEDFWLGEEETSGADHLTTICMVAIAQILIQNNII